MMTKTNAWTANGILVTTLRTSFEDSLDMVVIATEPKRRVNILMEIVKMLLPK